MQGITLSDLAAMSAQEQKQYLGENLYTRIISIDPLFQDMDLAGKITGMLLEMDNADLLHLLESQDALREKVQEAIAVLEAHKHKENTSQLSAAAMAGMPRALPTMPWVPPTRLQYTPVARNRPTPQGEDVSVVNTHHMHACACTSCCMHILNLIVLTCFDNA